MQFTKKENPISQNINHTETSSLKLKLLRQFIKRGYNNFVSGLFWNAFPRILFANLHPSLDTVITTVTADFAETVLLLTVAMFSLDDMNNFSRLYRGALLI